MTATHHDDPLGLAGRSIDERYQIDQFVTEGGFGALYRGTHRALECRVAIKFLKVPPELDAAQRQGFEAGFAQEARVIARLRHPALVQVMDFGIATLPDGRRAPWMAMEWLDGETLEAALTRRASVGYTPGEILSLLRPVFDALAHAHDEGIAHRDIKTANIMVVRTLSA